MPIPTAGLIASGTIYPSLFIKYDKSLPPPQGFQCLQAGLNDRVIGISFEGTEQPALPNSTYPLPAATAGNSLPYYANAQTDVLLTAGAAWNAGDHLVSDASGRGVPMATSGAPQNVGVEKDFWNVIDPKDGKILAKIEPKSGAHNTLISLDGTKAFLAGLKSHVLTVADCSTHKAASTITFSDNVRPFTMNGKGTTIYACLNNLLGFEVGDVATGQMLYRVEVPGFKSGKVLRHGCPSHGIAMTPDEREIWVSDAHNKRMHIYDNTVMPPKYVESIELRDEPGWVTMSILGTIAIPSTGDIVDVKTRKIVARLTDETGAAVQSEKLLEIEIAWPNGDIRTGDQFGFGRVTK